MKTDDLTIILLRLLGIYCFIESVPAFRDMFQIITLFIFEYDSIQHDTLGRIFPLFSALYGVILIIMGIYLIKSAPELARRMTPGESSDSLILKYESKDIQAVAFSIVGILVILLAVPALWFNLGQLFMWYSDDISDVRRDTQTIRTYWMRSIGPLLQMGLGLWLFFGSRGLSRLWHKLRTA